MIIFKKGNMSAAKAFITKPIENFGGALVKRGRKNCKDCNRK